MTTAPVGQPVTQGTATALRLPLPEALPAQDAELDAAIRAVSANGDPVAAFADQAGRDALRTLLARGHNRAALPAPRSAPPWALAAPTGQAQAEQIEHDAYFAVERTTGDAARAFTTGVLLAHLAAYDNALAMGVTVLGPGDWEALFGGLAVLLGNGAAATPPPPPTGWRPGYDPAARWLIGHQLFFALIQGSIIGLNTFAAAAPDTPGAAPARARGLETATAFLRASAAAMRFTGDFEPADYDRTVRPDMAPPRVRAGFSGFQTRDHAHLVRQLTALKPAFAALDERLTAHEDLADAVVAAYEAHEFVCARFHGDVLPSLRMAAASHGRTDRAGVEVVRELMRKRLGLVDPGSTRGRG